jgi:hypothetical protein
MRPHGCRTDYDYKSNVKLALCVHTDVKRRFISCTPNIIRMIKVEEDEMGKACRKRVGEEECM